MDAEVVSDHPITPHNRVEESSVSFVQSWERMTIGMRIVLDSIVDVIPDRHAGMETHK